MIRFYSFLILFILSPFLWDCYALCAERSDSSNGDLVVATYDSLLAEQGLGPLLAKQFKERTGSNIRWVRVGDSGQLLNRLQIEEKKSEPQIHIVLGVDSLVVDQFRSLTTGEFIPFDWGWFVFLIHSDLISSPENIADLLKREFYKKWILQDPRSSTPGYQFRLALRNNGFPEELWSDLSRTWFALTPSWDSAYQLFRQKVVPIVWTYGTSLAAESGSNLKAVNLFKEVPIQVEGVMVAKSVLSGSKIEHLSKQFIETLLSPEVQKLIPTTQWMMPAVSGTPLPPAFKKLEIPPFKMPKNPIKTSEIDSGFNFRLIFQWIQNSLWLGLVSAFGSLMIGLALARGWLEFKRRDSFWVRTIESVSILPFILSSTVISSAVLIRSQQWGFELGFGLVVLCHCLINSMWVSSKITDDWIRLPADSFQVARSLGLGKSRSFWVSFVLPLSSRLQSIFLVVFLFSFTSFATVMILGGGPPVSTIETEIFAALRLGETSRISLLILLLVQFSILISFTAALEPKNKSVLGSSLKNIRSDTSKGMRTLFQFGWGLFFLISFWILLPMLGIPRELASGLVPARNSIVLAFISASITVFIAVLLQRVLGQSVRGKLVRAFMSAVSPIAWATFLFWLVAAHLDSLRGSWFWMITAQVLFFMSFTLRSLEGALGAQLELELLWARACGAGKWLRFKTIWLPTVGPEIYRLLGIVMIFAMGDLVSVGLFGGEDSRFLVLEMARASARMDFELSSELGKWWTLIAMGLLIVTGQRSRRI